VATTEVIIPCQLEGSGVSSVVVQEGDCDAAPRESLVRAHAQGRGENVPALLEDDGVLFELNPRALEEPDAARAEFASPGRGVGRHDNLQIVRQRVEGDEAVNRFPPADGARYLPRSLV